MHYLTIIKRIQKNDKRISLFGYDNGKTVKKCIKMIRTLQKHSEALRKIQNTIQDIHKFCM